MDSETTQQFQNGITLPIKTKRRSCAIPVHNIQCSLRVQIIKEFGAGKSNKQNHTAILRYPNKEIKTGHS